MSNRVKVTVYGAKSLGAQEVGLLVIKVRIPPKLRGKKHKHERRIYSDGVAAGVAKIMQHYQPEGDGF